MYSMRVWSSAWPTVHARDARVWTRQWPHSTELWRCSKQHPSMCNALGLEAYKCLHPSRLALPQSSHRSSLHISCRHVPHSLSHGMPETESHGMRETESHGIPEAGSDTIGEPTHLDFAVCYVCPPPLCSPSVSTASLCLFCLHKFLCVYVCVCVCVCVCAYACLCVYIYICMYVCIHV